MNKLRVSYTLLSLWKQGRHQEAITSYFHLPREITDPMKLGKKWDDYVRDYVKEHKRFPKEFGGKVLNNPEPQKKIVVPYNEVFDLVGVFDVYDSPTLYEIKAGKGKDSAEYVNDYQIALYFLLCHLQKIPVEVGYLMRLHPETLEMDTSQVWNTPYERNRARNLIDSVAPEIYTFFTERDYFNQPPTIDKISIV